MRISRVDSRLGSSIEMANADRGETITDSLWWKHFVDEWNVAPERHQLANLGVIVFVVRCDQQSHKFAVEWGAEGFARICDFDTPTAKFSARIADWHDFIEGKFTATMGVLSGRITFEGELRRILPYSIALNSLAVVARRVSISV